MSTNIFTDVKKYTFSELVDKYKYFKIPPFQRAYNWRDKQIDTLWESIASHNIGYFIGTIVCLEPLIDENKLIIIDGQQRLITLSMILSAIYYKIKDLKENIVDEKDKDDINTNLEIIKNQLFFKQDLYMGAPWIIRITLGKEKYNDVYDDILKGDKSLNDRSTIQKLGDKEKIFIKNYKSIIKFLDIFLADNNNNIDRIRNLIYLAGKIQRLQLIVIVCRTDVDAYDIFEGLNATGIGLSVADLVKNSVMSSVKEKSNKELIEEKWNSLEDIFYENQSVLFPRFLRHQWISKNGYVSNSQLFRKIKTEKLENPDDTIIQYVDELQSDASIYIAFYDDKYNRNFDEKLNKEIINRLSTFKHLDNLQVFELLLSFYNKFITDNNYTSQQFEESLINLWNFCFRAKILQINPSSYERIFAEHAKEIIDYKKNEMNRMSTSFFQKLKSLVHSEANDNLFISNFKNQLKYKINADNQLIRLILNDLMDHNNQYGITTDDPTIEHILPIDPSKWKLNKDDTDQYVHNIGNLTILNSNFNGSLSNETIDIKVDTVYSSSPFNINKEIEKYREQFKSNPEKAINNRGEELAKLANKVFKIHP